MLTVMRTNKFTDVKHILNFNYPPPSFTSLHNNMHRRHRGVVS